MNRRQAFAVLTLALVAGCTSGPRTLMPGTDTCEFCRMTIDDVRFGAMVITSRGRIQTFDSIECLASYVAALSPTDSPRGVFVADFEHPAQWVNASQATYLHRSQLRSPMGRELAAFARQSDRAALTRQYGGTAMAWSEVLTLVANAQPHGAAHRVRPEQYGARRR